MPDHVHTLVAEQVAHVLDLRLDRDFLARCRVFAVPEHVGHDDPVRVQSAPGAPIIEGTEQAMHEDHGRHGGSLGRAGSVARICVTPVRAR